MSRDPSISYVRQKLAELADPTAINAFEDLIRELEGTGPAHKEDKKFPDLLICERYTQGNYEMGWNRCMQRSMELRGGIPEKDFLNEIYHGDEKKGWDDCRAALIYTASVHNAEQREYAATAKDKLMIT